MTSNTSADIAWPIWALSYTVTPQTYMRDHAWLDGLERLLGAGQRVVDLDGHFQHQLQCVSLRCRL